LKNDTHLLKKFNFLYSLFFIKANNKKLSKIRVYIRAK